MEITNAYMLDHNGERCGCGSVSGSVSPEGWDYLCAECAIELDRQIAAAK